MAGEALCWIGAHPAKAAAAKRAAVFIDAFISFSSCGFPHLKVQA
jgi:hypothetical protein